MAHQQLNSSQIHSCFKQMRGKAMAKGMNAASLCYASPLLGIVVNSLWRALFIGLSEYAPGKSHKKGLVLSVVSSQFRQ